jgi:nitrogen regulatory protein PII-like uncharacterized protein
VASRHRVRVFTLAEPHYYEGVAALINSLVAVGFTSQFVLYHKGPAPSWWEDAAQLLAELEVELVARQLDDTQHPAVLKPIVAMRALDQATPDDVWVYLDPDIVVHGDWSFFEEWTGFGVALVEEVVHFRMTDRHPLRQRWCSWAEGKGLKVVRSNLPYFNSGFFSVSIASKQFLRCWSDVIRLAAEDGYDARNVNRSRTQLFSTWDQDSMNVALSICDVDLSFIGPEGMGFLGSGYTMHHGVGTPKPWARKHVRLALRGIPPREVDLAFYRATKRPIRTRGNVALAMAGARILAARLIARVVRR